MQPYAVADALSLVNVPFLSFWCRFIGVGVREAPALVREGWFHHGCISNSHTKTPLCHVGLCYEYLTHPRIDAQFYRLELKNESLVFWCGAAPHRLLYCKNSHLQQQRNTFPLQMRVYSNLVEANLSDFPS